MTLRAFVTVCPTLRLGEGAGGSDARIDVADVPMANASASVFKREPMPEHEPATGQSSTGSATVFAFPLLLMASRTCLSSP